MLINKSKLVENSLLLAVSLSFLGFYTFLVLLDNAGFIAISRQFSIPFRIFISLLFIYAYIITKKTKPKANVLIFLVYIFFIFIRILIDVINNEPYYMSYSNLILFLVSFCVIPYLSICLTPVKISFFNRLNNYLLFFSFVFASVAAFSLKKFIGEVTRLNSSAVGEDVISPLILSYCSTLCIGIALSFILTKSNGILKKSIAIITILLSIIPFFLGASRGALVALFLSIFSYLIVKFKFKSILYGIMFLVISVGIIYFLDDYLDTGLLERFLGTSNAINQGGDSAIRLEIWSMSLEQFLNNPFFGDRLQMNFSNHYPHNIFIESLQAFGLIGTLPLIILLFMAIKRSIVIFRQQKFIWIPFIFIQSLTQYMFSGSLFNAAWFWVSLSLIFAVYNLTQPKYK